MILAIALGALAVAVATAAFTLLLRDAMVQLRADYRHLATVLGRLVDDVDLVRGGAPTAEATPLEQLRQRWNGVAPAPPWGVIPGTPPVDMSIPTSASLPPKEPGDADTFEVEEEDKRPLSTTPPEP